MSATYALAHDLYLSGLILGNTEVSKILGVSMDEAKQATSALQANGLIRREPGAAAEYRIASRPRDSLIAQALAASPRSVWDLGLRSVAG